MRQNLVCFVAILMMSVALLIPQSASAQIGNFGSLIGLPDSTTLDSFLNQQATLQGDSILLDTSFTQQGAGEAQDSLQSALSNGTNPFPINVDSILWELGISDLLAGLFSSDNFSTEDIDTMSVMLDTIGFSWFNPQDDTLGLVFPPLVDSAGILPTVSLPDSMANDTLWQQAQDAQNLDLSEALDTTVSNGIFGNVGGAIDTLFSDQFFPSLRLRAGVQNVKFLNLFGHKAVPFDATVIGVGSKRDFSRPWLASWDLWSSFTTEPFEFLQESEGGGNILVGEEGFNPLQLGFNFTTYRTFGSPFGVRLISGIGFGAATYAPSHSELRAENVGWTTACTAEVSLGSAFVSQDGKYSVYTLLTVSRGPVTKGHGYVHKGLRVESGVNIGPVSARYTISNDGWASNGNKQLRSHTFTVGIPLNWRR